MIERRSGGVAYSSAVGGAGKLITLPPFFSVPRRGKAPVMRIQFKMEGGIAHFPGLARPINLNSLDLPQEEQDDLAEIIALTEFFNLPSKMDSPHSGAADYRRYTIQIEIDQKNHTVSFTDPVISPHCQRLIQYLLQKMTRARKGL